MKYDEAYTADQLIENIQQLSVDVETYYEHVQNGTLHDYYKSVINQTAATIVFVPFFSNIKLNEDGVEKIDLAETSKDVVSAFPEIVGTIASMFVKDEKSVSSDLMIAIASCPLEDLKIAKSLKRQHRLN